MRHPSPFLTVQPNSTSCGGRGHFVKIPLGGKTNTKLCFRAVYETFGLDQWKFINSNGKPHSVKVTGNFETNNCDALRAAIYADAGIALRPVWDVWEDIKAGSLQVLLPEYTHPSVNIQAVYPSRRHLSQKVRVFIDLLCESFGETPYWDLP